MITICIKNAIRTIFSREGITTVPRGKNAWSKDGLRWLRTHAKPLEEIVDIDQLWRGQLHEARRKYGDMVVGLTRSRGCNRGNAW